MPALHEIASEAAQWFTTVKRGEDTIDTLKDGRPSWVQDLVREAHGGMMPDDWRYAAIRAAVEHVSDSGAETERDLEDADHEYADAQVDVYTSDRLAWLASNLNRPGYVDEAAAEFGTDADADTVDRIGRGQYMEAREVWGSVVRSLVAEQEAREQD